MKRMQYSGYNKRFRYEPQGYMHSRKWRRKMNLESNDCINQNHGSEKKEESWKKINERIGTNEADMNSYLRSMYKKVNITGEITGKYRQIEIKDNFPSLLFHTSIFRIFPFYYLGYLPQSLNRCCYHVIKPLYGQTVYITSFIFLY